MSRQKSEARAVQSCLVGKSWVRETGRVELRKAGLTCVAFQMSMHLAFTSELAASVQDNSEKGAEEAGEGRGKGAVAREGKGRGKEGKGGREKEKMRLLKLILSSPRSGPKIGQD